MKGVMIGRPINGISINGNEYVCDDKGLTIVFLDEKDARGFLKENGYTNDAIENEGIVFEEVNDEDAEQSAFAALK